MALHRQQPAERCGNDILPFRPPARQFFPLVFDEPVDCFELSTGSRGCLAQALFLQFIRATTGAMGMFTRRTELLDTEFFNITRRLVAPQVLSRQPDQIRWGSRHHPQHHSFIAPIKVRARAHYTQTPDAIIGGWAAAAYAGLDYWVDDAHITLHVKSNFRLSHNPLDATRRRLRAETNVWTPDSEMPGMQVVAPEFALVDCLIDLQRSHHSWWVYEVPNFDLWEVRAIQLIDALRRCCKHTLKFDLVCKAARNIFSARQLKKLWRLSSTGAESPPETALRLIAKQVRDCLDVQIPIYDSGALSDDGSKRLTTLDSGWRDIQVALLYDGEHHLRRDQRDYDATVFIRLCELSWVPLRITHGLLRNPRRLIATLRHAIKRAEDNAKS